MEHFSDRLRHARKLRKLSQASLAKACGLSQGAIASYENRTRKATTNIIRLAQALNVNPIWLDTGIGSMTVLPDIAISVPSDSKLREFEGLAPTAVWPFQTVQPSDYWSLAESERCIVEQTIATLILALHKKNPDKQDT